MSVVIPQEVRTGDVVKKEKGLVISDERKNWESQGNLKGGGKGRGRGLGNIMGANLIYAYASPELRCFLLGRWSHERRSLEGTSAT